MARKGKFPTQRRERQRALSTHFPVLADSSTFSTHPCRSSQSCVELLLAQCDSWRLMLVGARYDATYPTPHSREQSAPRSLSVEGELLPQGPGIGTTVQYQSKTTQQILRSPMSDTLLSSLALLLPLREIASRAPFFASPQILT